jgi:putative phosphoribosyl transferase
MRRMELIARRPEHVRGRMPLQPFAAGHAREVSISVAPGAALRGDLAVPRGARTRGVVVLAGGLGASRRDARTRKATRCLNEAGMATLAVDLLTPLEQQYLFRLFDDELLALRLLAIGGWLERQPETGALPLGYFAPGGDAQVTLRAARRSGASVCAVLLPGERIAPGLMDDAMSAEQQVLLIAGEGACGSRDVRVALLATRWFGAQMRGRSRPRPVPQPALRLVPTARKTTECG